MFNLKNLPFWAYSCTVTFYVSTQKQALFYGGYIMEHRNKWILLASSNSLDSLSKLVKEYGYLSKCILHPDGSIENAKGIISNWRWRLSRGRYRFEILI